MSRRTVFEEILQTVIGGPLCEVCEEAGLSHVVKMPMSPKDHVAGCRCNEAEKAAGLVYICEKCADHFRKCIAGRCPTPRNCDGPNSYEKGTVVMTIAELADEQLEGIAKKFNTYPEIIRFGIHHRLTAPEAVAVVAALEAAGHAIDFESLGPRIILREPDESPAQEKNPTYPEPVVMVPSDGIVH